MRTTDAMRYQFQHEFRKEKLHFNFVVESGYDSLPVRSVMADMPRVGQVLINLMVCATAGLAQGLRAPGVPIAMKEERC